MKKYTVQETEDFGSIAGKFGIPSWKYLYQLNKDVIGDNPDLLKPGTVLEMPEWNSTSGDEKIEAKGEDPSRWTNGLSYRYPWAPYSATMAGYDGSLYTEKNGKNERSSVFDKKKTFTIYDGDHSAVLAQGEVGASDEIETLIPDAANTLLDVEGILFKQARRK